jgi:hypothetical protein
VPAVAFAQQINYLVLGHRRTPSGEDYLRDIQETPELVFEYQVRLSAR